MSETPLMNDDAARSTTGEILDQSTPLTETKTETTPQSTDSKPEPTDGKTQEVAPETKPETKPEAPAAYADFKAPEGYQIDPEVLKEALPVFKDLGLTQDQAQKLVDIQIQRDLAIAKARDDTYSALRSEWQGKVKSDPELAKAATDGKVGLDAVKLDIGRAIAVLPPALQTDFRDAMNLTGAGDHPAFVKAMWQLSKLIGPGTAVKGNGPSPHGQANPDKPAAVSAAKALYPNLA